MRSMARRRSNRRRCAGEEDRSRRPVEDGRGEDVRLPLPDSFEWTAMADRSCTAPSRERPGYAAALTVTPQPATSAVRGNAGGLAQQDVKLGDCALYCDIYNSLGVEASLRSYAHRTFSQHGVRCVTHRRPFHEDAMAVAAVSDGYLCLAQCMRTCRGRVRRKDSASACINRWSPP